MELVYTVGGALLALVTTVLALVIDFFQRASSPRRTVPVALLMLAVPTLTVGVIVAAVNIPGEPSLAPLFVSAALSLGAMAAMIWFTSRLGSKG
jgi:FtsH-binding integral membrane protein